jgi:hypothetical protein
MSAHLLQSDIADATAEVLLDVESILDWTYAEIRNCFPSKWPHLGEATSHDLSHVTVANLVGLLFDAGQSKVVTKAARDAWAERYLADPEVKARVEVIAQRIARERAEDERQDREEREADLRRSLGYTTAAWPTREAA